MALDLSQVEVARRPHRLTTGTAQAVLSGSSSAIVAQMVLAVVAPKVRTRWDVSASAAYVMGAQIVFDGGYTVV